MVTHDSRERPGLPARRREAFYTKISDATVLTAFARILAAFPRVITKTSGGKSRIYK